MRTVGVEEEMLLVDVRTGRPRSVSGQMLAHAPRRRPESAGVGVHGAIAAEMQQQQIETRTAPAADMAALRAEVRRWRSEAVSAARGTGFERRRARHLAAARAPGPDEVAAVRLAGGPLPAHRT